MGTRQKSSDNDRQQFWQRALEAQQESGISIAAFCKKEGIRQSAYYYWRRKLAGGVSKPNQKSPPDFLEVVMPAGNTVALELVLSSGHTLRINPGADDKILGHALSDLKQAGLC